MSRWTVHAVLGGPGRGPGAATEVSAPVAGPVEPMLLLAGVPVAGPVAGPVVGPVAGPVAAAAAAAAWRKTHPMEVQRGPVALPVHPSLRRVSVATLHFDRTRNTYLVGVIAESSRHKSS